MHAAVRSPNRLRCIVVSLCERPIRSYLLQRTTCRRKLPHDTPWAVIPAQAGATSQPAPLDHCFYFGRISGNITPNVLPPSTTRGSHLNKFGQKQKQCSAYRAPQGSQHLQARHPCGSVMPALTGGCNLCCPYVNSASTRSRLAHPNSSWCAAANIQSPLSYVAAPARCFEAGPLLRSLAANTPQVQGAIAGG